MTGGDSDPIVPAEDPKRYHGAAGVESLVRAGNAVCSGVSEGDWDAFALAADGLALGIDALAATRNPFQAVVQAGVGALFENVGFLREPLEWLTGDPRAVAALSQTWANIAQELEGAATGYESALRTLGSWSGDTATAYRAAAHGVVEVLRGTAGSAASTAKGIMSAGIMVATVRGIVFDMISRFLARMLIQALFALKVAGPTFGASLSVFLTSLQIDAAVLAARIAARLAKLAGSSRLFARQFGRMGDLSASLAGRSRAYARRINAEAGERLKPGTSVRVPGGVTDPSAPSFTYRDSGGTFPHHLDGAAAGFKGGERQVQDTPPWEDPLAEDDQQ